MNPFKSRWSAWRVAGLAMLAGLGSIQAQAAYPERPVTLLVPFAAGGPTDIVARALASSMEKSLGQTVVVENKPSAGGVVAPGEVARSTPDGYKILIHHLGMATAPSLYRKLAYKPTEDFVHLGLINAVPMTLLARPNFPANNMAEAVKYIQANSKTLNLANAGLGAASHLCGLMFMSIINTDLTTVPYKGTAPALTDLMGGQTDLLCDQTTATIPHIKGGKIKVFAVTSPQRIEAIKEVPTAAEAGLKGFELSIWHGLYAPKGLPPEIAKKLNDSLRAAMKDENFKKRMVELGSVMFPENQLTPEAHLSFLKSETERWGKLIVKSGQFAD